MIELIDNIVKLAENAGIEGFTSSHAGHIVNNWAQGREPGEDTYSKVLAACDRAEKLPGFPALFVRGRRRKRGRVTVHGRACDRAHDIAMLVSAWAEAHPMVDDE
jgi:hypothetical protein